LLKIKKEQLKQEKSLSTKTESLVDAKRSFGTIKSFFLENLKYYAICYFASALLLYIFFKSAAVLAIALPLPYLGRKIYFDYLKTKRERRLRNEFKDLLYSLSASFASGRGMTEALNDAKENLGHIYDESLLMESLDPYLLRLNESRDREDLILKEYAEEIELDDIAEFFNIYLVCRGSGADQLRLISNASEILMDKLDILAQIDKIAAEKLLEARIIGLMPLGLIAGLNLSSPDYLAVLYTTLAGRIVMLLSLAMLVFGYYLINKMCRIEV